MVEVAEVVEHRWKGAPLWDEVHGREGRIARVQRSASDTLEFKAEYELAVEDVSQARSSHRKRAPRGKGQCCISEDDARDQIQRFLQMAADRAEQAPSGSVGSSAIVALCGPPLAVLTRDLFVHCGLWRFREHQEEIIRALLMGQDAMVVASTGFGKSLCFQLPALRAHRMASKVTIVVSPLTALMEDQVMGLNKGPAGTVATFLGSMQSDGTMDARAAAGEVRRGDSHLARVAIRNAVGSAELATAPALQFALVYVTPQKLMTPAGKWLIGQLGTQLGSVVIDEAHCITEWGSDFVLAYGDLGYLRNSDSPWLPRSVPIVALTATARPAVREQM